MIAPLSGPAAALENTKPKNATFVNMSASQIQPFNVLILYDNALSGVRGMQTYESFCRELSNDYVFAVKLWRLDMLHQADPSQLPLPRLESADMVIVACEADYDSLVLLDGWAARWPRAHDDAKRALVALYTGPAENRGTNSYERWLAALGSLAERVGLDFITHAAEVTSPGRLGDFAAPTGSARPVRAVSLPVKPSAPAPVVEPEQVGFDLLALAAFSFGTPRWGINE